MTRGNRIILNLIICGLLGAFKIWHDGWYLDREKCFQDLMVLSPELSEGILIGETELDDVVHRVIYHEESDRFSIAELKTWMMLSSFGDTYNQFFPFAESDLKAFGVMFHNCNQSRQMVVVFQRYDENVDRVEIECKDGQRIIIDQWDENFYVYTTTEYLRPMSGTYRSYDQHGNVIDELRWG